MEITRATEYAIRAVLHLALAEAGRVVPRREIAERWGIPEQFLGKIAQRLARADHDQNSIGGDNLCR